MFFILSKIFWVLMQPLNLLCALGALGWAARRRWPTLGQKLMNGALVLIIIIGILPIGTFAITWLERQYPTPQSLPDPVDGIIVLGGPFEAARTKKTGQLVVNDQIDRALCFASLARKYPNARLAFTGGTGDILNPDANESDDAKIFFDLIGLSNRNIIYESQSRNTYENAVFTKKLMTPKSDETWVVTTSAYHMPRTVATFAKVGWDIIPYQCDLRTDGTYSLFRGLPNIAGNFSLMNLAIKEIFGMIVYRITGKSAFIFTHPQVASPHDPV